MGDGVAETVGDRFWGLLTEVSIGLMGLWKMRYIRGHGQKEEKVKKRG